MARLGGVCWNVCADLLDSSGCKLRPQTGSLNPVAEAASSSLDPLNRGTLS
jgi:hypothetical protein